MKRWRVWLNTQQHDELFTDIKADSIERNRLLQKYIQILKDDRNPEKQVDKLLGVLK